MYRQHDIPPLWDKKKGVCVPAMLQVSLVCKSPIILISFVFSAGTMLSRQIFCEILKRETAI